MLRPLISETHAARRRRSACWKARLTGLPCTRLARSAELIGRGGDLRGLLLAPTPAAAGAEKPVTCAADAPRSWRQSSAAIDRLRV